MLRSKVRTDGAIPRRTGSAVLAGLAVMAIVGLAGCGGSGTSSATSSSTTAAPANPAVTNVYEKAGAGMLAPGTAGALERVYVPNHSTNNVTVIDPATMKVVGVEPVGLSPQHVVPSYDMTKLWVANNADGTTKGSLTPIDPKTGKTGDPIDVDDPYNLYFTPDGKSAIVVAEARKRLDFRDPQTMAVQSSLEVPTCPGINHMDYSADGSYLLATCEDAHSIVKIDWAGRKVLGTLDLGADAMPQDLRLSPTGKEFYVGDMMGNQLLVIDGGSLSITKHIDLAATGGLGAHGIYPSRDGTKLYVANRGSATRGASGPRHSKGSVSVVDVRTDEVVANWPVPDGGSPDMGGVSADGSRLWLSGRWDDEVYAFDTATGKLVGRISVAPDGKEPHGLCVWPQPGRYSLGHTGNTR